MKVTAAITTYNRAAFLPGALESVFAQTRQPDEVLVVDDGSTDDTQEVLSAYGDRVRVVRQENAGRSGARNRAVEEARGELLSFLDSDDRWLPDKLARQVPVLEARRARRDGARARRRDRRGRRVARRRDTAATTSCSAAAHRNGVTYAGYAFDCRCFCPR